MTSEILILNSCLMVRVAEWSKSYNFLNRGRFEYLYWFFFVRVRVDVIGNYFSNLEFHFDPKMLILR